MVLNRGLFSSDKDDWQTPFGLFSELDSRFHFTLDAAASGSNHLCDKFFSVDDSAFNHSWKGETVFCNPPYGRGLRDWVRKCHDESVVNNITVVMLIPARTDTSYFHDYIYNFAHIEFIRGRIKFLSDGVSVGSAPFPSMVVVFNYNGE